MTQGSNIIVPQRVRLIPMEKVVALMATACSAYELPRSEAQIIDAMLSAFPTATIHDAKFLSYEDVVLFMDNWVRALKTKDFNFLTMKRGKRWELPPTEEIIDSPEYLNQKTQIRPAIKREILRMYENGAYYPEILLTGATGIGKDYASYIIYGITLMELYSYWNPQIEFGLAAGTSIILAIQSITKELAKQVTFNELVGTVLSNSKFFKEKFPWDKHVTTELRFPNNIYVRPFSGEDTSALGMAIFSAISNEMAFMNVVAKSKKAGGQEYNQAARIYRTLSRRIKGRFLKHGKVPGKMILISSANKEGDFMWQRLQEVEAMKPEDKAKVFVMKMSQWASFEGLDRLLPESFLVEKGDGTKQSRIIESRDDAIDPEDVIEVPMDYREEFEKDIDGALADIAGEFIAGGRKKFIPYKEDMAKAIQAHKEANDNTQLFRKEAIIFDKEVDPYHPDYTRIVNMEYIKNILAPSLSYAVHIDYGFTGDGTGVAISHVPHYKLMDKARIYDPVSNGYILQQNLNLPVYHIDGVIQIKASSGSEVDIDFVEGLIYFLKEHINIQWVTFDSYESRASIQGFKKRGIISGVVSTVSNKEPYAELKNAIKTGRIMYPDSSILAKEIRDLERLPDGKIDHPSTGDGSKDCADAVAGTIYVLMRGALKQSSRAQTTRREDTQHQRTPVTQRRSRFSQV